MNNKVVTEPQKFVGNIIWVAASNLMIPLVGLVTLPALTRNYTTADYAVWMQTVFIVALLPFILNLCLGYAVIRFLAAEADVAKRRQAVGVMLWPALALSCLAIILSILLARDLSIILFTTADYAHLMPLTFLWAALDGIYSILIAYWMASRQIIKWSISQMALALYKMVIIVTLATIGSSLDRIIGFIIAGEIVIIFIVLGMIVKDIGWLKFGLEDLKDYLAFSMPLIPGGVLFWVISYSDRYFITYLLSLSQAGIYSASFSIGMLIFFFYSPLQIVLFPVLSKLWEQNDQLGVRSYLEYSNKLFLTLAIPGAAGLYILSQPLLGILTTSEYMAGANLVLLIAVATILLGLYQINVYMIILVKQTKWLLLIITLAAISNIGLNLVLIPVMGVIGAAISSIIAHLILATATIIWTRNVIRYRISVNFVAKVIIGAIVMAWCISFIHIGGILGIAVISITGVIIIGFWLWLTRVFSAEDIKLIKEIISGFRQGALLR